MNLIQADEETLLESHENEDVDIRWSVKGRVGAGGAVQDCYSKFQTYSRMIRVCTCRRDRYERNDVNNNPIFSELIKAYTSIYLFCCIGLLLQPFKGNRYKLLPMTLILNSLYSYSQSTNCKQFFQCASCLHHNLENYM